jgi:hypothetical protein
MKMTDHNPNQELSERMAPLAVMLILITILLTLFV